MPDTDPTAQEVEAEKRARALNAAEEQAWTALARAVDLSNNFDTRRREAEHAASLFTCVAAIVGQPTMPGPGVNVVNTVPDLDPEMIARAFADMSAEDRALVGEILRETPHDPPTTESTDGK